MKTISKLIPILFAAVAAVGGVACEKQGKYLNVTPLEINHSDEPTEVAVSIRVDASAAWMFSQSADWFSASYEKDGALLWVSISRNESPDERRDIIDISTADAQTVKVVVVQAGASETPPEGGSDTPEPENPAEPEPDNPGGTDTPDTPDVPMPAGPTAETPEPDARAAAELHKTRIPAGWNRR